MASINQQNGIYPPSNALTASDTKRVDISHENTEHSIQNVVQKCYQNDLKNFLLSNITTKHPTHQYKSSMDLEIEHTNCISNYKHIDIYTNCHSIQRILILLRSYNKIRTEIRECTQISLTNILSYPNIYTLTEINNDFLHIKDHFEHNKQNEITLARQFRQQFQSVQFGYRRMRQQRDTKYKPTHTQWKDNEDIIFQQTCEKIYGYLTHIEVDDEKQHTNKFHTHYAGKTEDNKWLNYQTDVKSDDNELIYQYLIKTTGIFRWQSFHGFKSKQHHALMHLKAKYDNIKQEVLYNPYYQLSKDNWNQTLRKSSVFYNSFARKRISTTYAGKFEDKIVLRNTSWNKGETISLQEILIFKLYTDFDKLQYELKKCFRFESMFDVFTLNRFDSNTNMSVFGNVKANNNQEHNLRCSLETRLQTFYWWRIRLLTVLNKYATAINCNIPLYHGINAKMIINNSPRSGFYGPLSATLSYHVAGTFATSKGMVLEVTSQFPRLNICRAFDVSLLSDYPEEKERLISFAYLRIKRVFTRPLNKKWKTFDDIDNEENNCKIPLSSQLRSIFFAIHLFRQQIFSMSLHSEYWLAAFLYLYCKYNELYDKKDNNRINKTKFVDELKGINSYKYSGNDMFDRYHRILTICRDKFENFRKYPNRKQVVKIDIISNNLKPYFMDYVCLDIYQNEQYAVSFAKIGKIFENIKEIHFLNRHLCDNMTLCKLIQYLKDNPNTQLHTIKFLYYDYQTAFINDNINIDKKSYPTDSNIFVDPSQLDKSLLRRLNKMNWHIKHKNIANTGYEIKLFSRK